MDLSADLLLHNGRIWTGRGGRAAGPEPSVIAIRDGRIVGLGEASEAEHWLGAETRAVDLGGRRVIPGLVDSHLHAIRAGLSYLDELDWTEVRSLSEALQSVARAAERLRAGQWILALGGWHPARFVDEPRMPTRQELDAASGDRPVFVHPVYGRDDFGVLSTAALEALGWVGDCPDPAGGRLHRLPDGSPDGRLSGAFAYAAVTRQVLTPDAARAEESTRAFFARLAALGMTGVIDAGGLGMSPDKYRAVRAVWRRGELPLRVRTYLGAALPGDEEAQLRQWQTFLDPSFGDELLSVLGAGEALHFGCHDWEGMDPFEMGEDAFRGLVRSLTTFAAQGWPVTVHAILDHSIGRILDAMEEVRAITPIEGLRWSLCHVECIGPENLRRVRELGLALAVQDRIAHKQGVCAQVWGERAVRNAPPLGDIVGLGIPFAAGTDGTRAASYNPWLSLWWLITGEAMDGGPRREERHRLDREAALDAYTRGSAWLSFEDDRRGTLRVGADADLAVLDEDYFAVPEERIPALSSLLTVVAGRVVHSSGALAAVPVQPQAPRPGPARAPLAAAAEAAAAS